MPVARLPPLPRELLEFGGSEDPQQEEREEACLKTEQAGWIEAVAQAAEPVFTRAKQILHKARVPLTFRTPSDGDPCIFLGAF